MSLLDWTTADVSVGLFAQFWLCLDVRFASNRPGEINHNDGGRGLYFPGPDGHHLEVITRPYGSGAS